MSGHKINRSLNGSKNGSKPNAAEKMAKKSDAAEKQYRHFALTRRAWLYLALWVAALVFTQALRSTASNIFFTFVNTLPIVSLVYVLIAKGRLKLQMLSERAKTEKFSPYVYTFKVINESILAFPFVEAIVRIPCRDAIRCSDRCVRLSLAPGEAFTVNNTVSFRFRGTYEIGVKCFCVYDFFRMMRVTIDVESFEPVSVIPRKLVIDDIGSRSVSDSAAQTMHLPNSYDKLEVSDIREYRLGDALKNVHWNLSSKSEELIVRDYNTGTTNLTYVFCDMNSYFSDTPPMSKSEKELMLELAGIKRKKTSKKKNTKGSSDDSVKSDQLSNEIDVHALASDEYYRDMNEFCADGAVELTVAAVLRELRLGNSVLLMWFDNRSKLGAFAYELTSAEDFELIFDLFTTAPVIREDDESKKSIFELSAMIPGSREAKSIYVFPTLNDEIAASLGEPNGASVNSSAGTAEAIFYDTEERFLNIKERREYIDACRARLAASGIMLSGQRLDASAGKEEAFNV